MSLALMQGFNSLSEASILLLMALGLAFTFGLMGVINMAHGEFIMLGAYVAYVLESFLGARPTFALLLGIPFAFLLTAGIGALLEMLVVRRLYGRPLDTLLATWGVSLLLQQLARTVFGAPNVEVASPGWLSGTWQPLPGLLLPDARLFILALATGVLALVYLYLFHTGIGRRTRAALQSREMAACLGISTRRLDLITFALGSGLAGLAGVVLTLIGPIGPSIGQDYIVDAFMVVVLGGVGQLTGTVAASGMFGLSKTLLEYWTTASRGTVLAFAFIIAFLQWRPMGIVSRRSRQLD